MTTVGTPSAKTRGLILDMKKGGRNQSRRDSAQFQRFCWQPTMIRQIASIAWTTRIMMETWLSAIWADLSAKLLT